MFVSNIAFSQDIHFSQFYASPLTLNPAQTGNHDAQWRVVDNYRNQWFTMTIPFVTNSVSVDRHFYLRDERLDVGVNVINDMSGDASLKVSKVYLSIAYKKNIKGNNFFIGIQPGYVMKSISIDNLSFPDQYNNQTGYFDPSKPTTGNYSGDDLSYFDVNAGIKWDKQFGRWKPELGIAVFHLNEPGESFLGTANKITHRKVAHVGTKFFFNSKYTINPYFLYMEHYGASEILYGSNVYINLEKNKSFAKSVFASLFFRDGINRNVDSVVAGGGINFYNTDIGISYDLNISSLHSATAFQGAFEISLIYYIFDECSKKMIIPCERY